MLKRIKNIVKRILPTSIFIYQREMKDFRKSMMTLINKYGNQVSSYEKSTQKELQAIERQLAQLKNEQEKMLKIVTNTEALANAAARHSSEAVWAEVFANVTSGSTWLKDDSIAPGRWALGYPGLYALYRILNEIHPKRILELGLGQSSRMIGQYAEANTDVEHLVIENNAEWISFFKNSFAISAKTEILQLELEIRPYKEAESVRAFKGLKEALEGKKFDLIFIDAPLGGDMKQYARVDVIGLIPDCLMNRFVIMLDDANRIGEKHTMTEIENEFEENHIEFSRGKYAGDKETVVWVSSDLNYLCSM